MRGPHFQDEAGPCVQQVDEPRGKAHGDGAATGTDRHAAYKPRAGVNAQTELVLQGKGVAVTLTHSCCFTGHKPRPRQLLPLTDHFPTSITAQRSTLTASPTAQHSLPHPLRTASSTMRHSLPAPVAVWRSLIHPPTLRRSLTGPPMARRTLPAPPTVRGPLAAPPMAQSQVGQTAPAAGDEF